MRDPAAADHRNEKGRQVSFILERKRPGASFTDRTKQRIDSPHDEQIYSHRMAAVEPVFVNIGSNKGLNRFSLRMKPRIQGQWRFYCTIHYIEKLANHGRLTG